MNQAQMYRNYCLFYLIQKQSTDFIVATVAIIIVAVISIRRINHMRNDFLQRSRQKSNSTYNNLSQERWLERQSKVSRINSEFSEPVEAKTAHKPTLREAANQQNSRGQQHNGRGQQPESTHSCYELMQDLLKGVNCEQEQWLVSTAQEEEQMGQLLTNRYKIESYKQQLKSRIRQGSPEGKHLKLLLVLLQQIASAQLEVTYRQQGLSVGFNAKLISTQQHQIHRLHQQNESSKRELQHLTKQYDGILFQLNEVIEKLVPREDKHHSYN